MNDTLPPLFTAQLSDETAYGLADMLNRMATAFENAYYAQIHSHIETLNENQNSNHDQPWR